MVSVERRFSSRARIGGGPEGARVLTVEVRLREVEVRQLAGRVGLHCAPRDGQGAIEGVGTRVEVVVRLFDTKTRQGGQNLGIVGVPFGGMLERRARDEVVLCTHSLPVEEESQHRFV